MAPVDSTRWTEKKFQKIIHFYHLYLNRTFTKTSFFTNKINYTLTSFSLLFSPLSAVKSFSFYFLRTYWIGRKCMACKNQLKFPGVIILRVDSNPPIYPFNCSQT